MAREDKETKVAMLAEKLSITKQEAEKIYEYDKAVEHGERTEHDLTPEQEKISRMYTRAGRKPTVYNLSKRERKPNATKGGIIAALAEFLAETSAFSADNIEITNKERQIKFQSAGEIFELTLVQKRKPKN